MTKKEKNFMVAVFFVPENSSELIKPFNKMLIFILKFTNQIFMAKTRSLGMHDLPRILITMPLIRYKEWRIQIINYHTEYNIILSPNKTL